MDENQTLAQLTPTVADHTLQQWFVDEGESRRRLDTFLVTRLPQVSRREITQWIAAGHARINGRVSTKGSPLRPKDTVTLHIRLSPLPNPNLPIQLLWVDDDIVVMNKPSGVPSVALRHDETDTAVNFLLGHFPEMATASPHRLESGIVHRLDTATSGLLLAARTRAPYTTLRHQFSSQIVQKQYLALVHGQLSQPGSRRSLLIPTGARGHHMSEATTGSGQEAQTDFTPVTQFPRHTLVRVSIPTGVRHQIRVHLAALGHPIVGDVAYGKLEENARLCLHAELLSFAHPQTGARVQFTCPLPEDFQAVQDRVTNTSSQLR